MVLANEQKASDPSGRALYVTGILPLSHTSSPARDERTRHPVRDSLGYRSFGTPERMLQGIEAMNIMRKGQVRRLERSDAIGESKFVTSLFESSKVKKVYSTFCAPNNLCNRTIR